MNADLMHTNHHQCIGMSYSINLDCLAQTPYDADASIHSID